MNPQTILEIIKLLLELAIRIHDDIPAAQRAEFWVQHQKDVEFWRERFRRLAGELTP